MAKKVYSHSKLSTFEQCTFKYKLRYIDKIKPELEKSIESHLGTCVHDALEWLYLKIKETQKVPTLDDIIIFYSEKWEKFYTPNIVIVKKDLDQKHYFQNGLKFLLDYYVKNQPFKDNTLEVEKKITLNLTEEHSLQGFIDRLVHNLETDEIEIHDYKTANTLPTQDKADEDRQLALYSLAIKEQFQNKEIKLIWHYLAHNQKIISKRTNEQLEKLKQEIIQLIKKIESTQNFPTKKSVLCDWCEYKNQCPHFNKKLETKKQEPKEIATTLDNYPTIRKYIRN